MIEHDSIQTFAQLIALRAKIQPDEHYITFLADGWDEEELLTYAQLDRRTRAIGALLHQRGLEPGDRVVIMLDTGIDFVTTFFGILIAGMVPVPVYPPARMARMKHYLRTLGSILDVARSRGIVIDERLMPLITPRLKSSIIQVSNEETRQAKGTMEPYPLTPSSPGFIQFTSGTTQRPRGVLLLQHQIFAQMDAYEGTLEHRAGDVAVCWVPLYHDLGLIGFVLSCLNAGIPLVLIRPADFLRDPMVWLRAVSKYRAAHSAAPNFAFEMCTRKLTDERLREEKVDLSCWKVAGSGGEPILMSTMEGFRDKFATYGFAPEALNPCFGLAENALAVSLYLRDEVFESVTVSRRGLLENQVLEPDSDEDARTLAGNGRALKGMEIRITSEEGEKLDERNIGEIWIRSPSLAAGYFGDGDRTARAFVEAEGERWLKTGDLGFLVNESLYICGRKKDMMIVHGRNFYPQDLEEIAAEVSGVRAGNVIAFSIKDTDGIERPILVCELDHRVSRRPQEIHREVGEALNGALGIQCNELLLLPRNSLPKTSSGKLQRSLARELYARGSLGKDTPGAIENLTVQGRVLLGRIQRRLLGRGSSIGEAQAQHTNGKRRGLSKRLDPRISDAVNAVGPEISVIELSPELRVDALGLGSLQLMELWLTLEQLYGVRIPSEAWSTIGTLAEVQALLEGSEEAPESDNGRGQHTADRRRSQVPRFIQELIEFQASVERTERPPWQASKASAAMLTFLSRTSRVIWRQHASGQRHIPTGESCILAGNHASYLDAPWLLSTMTPEVRKRLIAVSWEGLPKILSFFLSQAELIPIDPYGNFRDSMQSCLQVLEENRILLIFPEGARTHTGRIESFQPGLGILSLISQRPIVPFRIHGGFEIYPRDRALPRFVGWRRGSLERLEIHFGEPIAPPPLDPGRAWVQVREVVDKVRGAVDAL